MFHVEQTHENGRGFRLALCWLFGRNRFGHLGIRALLVPVRMFHVKQPTPLDIFGAGAPVVCQRLFPAMVQIYI